MRFLIDESAPKLEPQAVWTDGSSLPIYPAMEIAKSGRRRDERTEPTTKSGKNAKVGKVRKQRTYKHALPANFCHICWRNVKTVAFLVCGNIAKRECLKVSTPLG